MPPPQTLPAVGRGHPLPTSYLLAVLGALILAPTALDAFPTPFYAYRHFFFPLRALPSPRA